MASARTTPTRATTARRDSRLVTSAPAPRDDGTRCTAATCVRRLLLRPDRWHVRRRPVDVVGADHLPAADLLQHRGRRRHLHGLQRREPLHGRHLPNRLLLRQPGGKCAACSTISITGGTCDQCDDANTCTAATCVTGYFETSGGGACSACSTISITGGTCNRCDDANTCTMATCNTNYVPSGGTCNFDCVVTTDHPIPRHRTARTSRSPAAPATSAARDHLQHRHLRQRFLPRHRRPLRATARMSRWSAAPATSAATSAPARRPPATPATPAGPTAPAPPRRRRRRLRPRRQRRRRRPKRRRQLRRPRRRRLRL